ncbi:hypothetical protein GF324_05335 [bacterium]|nr:hypothetical protein [bacterium]
MPQPYNEHIQDLLRLTREMMVLADLGDRDRLDSSCGVLYGNLRDAAYKLRKEAELERSIHIERGIWDADSNIASTPVDPS